MRFNSPFIDFSKYLNKSRLASNKSNKVVVAVCWVAVAVAFAIAFLKIVFGVFLSS
jgi:hypothetical protein